MRSTVFYLFLFACTPLLALLSCTKSEIQFGTDQADSYIKVTSVDTINAVMSTYVMDSFSTTKPSSLLVGSYRDPALGLISTKPFLELTVPPAADITPDAVYDSITLILRPNKVFYGDTTQAQTFEVKELSQKIDYTYSYYLYNTSSIAEKSTSLGSQTFFIKPQADDSISIKLSDTKGQELFSKIRLKADEVQSQDQFLAYFRGISIAYTGSNPSLVVGINDTVTVRVHYHNTIPYPEAHSIDMKTYINGIYFNQVRTNRSGTTLGNVIGNGTGEVPVSLTNGIAYSQGTTGVMAKISFPGTRAAIQADTTTKLLAATLLLRAKEGSFDLYKMRLPASLSFIRTDASNVPGSMVYTSDGALVSAAPVLDNIYDTPAYYAFDVTSYVNDIIKNTSTDDHALFVLENQAGSMTSMSRALLSYSTSPGKSAQLILSLITVKR